MRNDFQSSEAIFTAAFHAFFHQNVFYVFARSLQPDSRIKQKVKLNSKKTNFQSGESINHSSFVFRNIKSDTTLERVVRLPSSYSTLSVEMGSSEMHQFEHLTYDTPGTCSRCHMKQETSAKSSQSIARYGVNFVRQKCALFTAEKKTHAELNKQNTI